MEAKSNKHGATSNSVLGSLIGRFITEDDTEGDNKQSIIQPKELSSVQKSNPNLRLESLPSVEIMEVQDSEI